MLLGFEQIFNEKKVVLLLGNVPYQHKQVVGSTSSKTEKEVVIIQATQKTIHDVEWNDHRFNGYANDNCIEEMVKF